MNPNASRVRPEYDRIENTLDDLTPNPQQFGRVYPPADIKSDIEQLSAFKHNPEFKKIKRYSDAKLLEKTFIDMVERGDWFNEEELYGDDPNYRGLFTVPTSDIDDTFNHVDIIGIISNETTKHEVVPFAIDLTYNTDDVKMSQKFKWKHVYGKKQTAPDGVSEFGDSYTEKDSSGRNILKTRPLPLKFRYGLKIPGFASAKYFENKNNPWDPIYEKGRINIMPRFIVGYSTDIANTLAIGMPTDEFRKKYGEEAYHKRQLGYKRAEKRAKWCTLFECHKQASDIRSMLENLSAEETKWMYPEELEKAKKQIIAMDTYFAKAIELATQKVPGNSEEIIAMKSAQRDAVCQAIIEHSNDTYIKKNWQ